MKPIGLTALIVLILVPGLVWAQSGDDDVQLTVTKQASLWGPVELSWTGGSPEYEVRRSASAETVYNPSTVQATTYDNTWSDTSGSGADLEFYLVQSRATCWNATSDTYVNSGFNRDNFGNEDVLEIDTIPEKISYVQFPIQDALPRGAIIESATLRVFKAFSNSGSEVSARRITEPWSEDEIVYLNRPASAEGYGVLPIDNHTTRIEWNVTSLVSGWFDGSLPAHGIALEPYGEDDFVGFTSREDVPAQLCVRWTTPLKESAELLRAESEIPPVIQTQNGVMTSMTARVPVVRFSGDSTALYFLERYKGLFGIEDAWADTWIDRIVTDEHGQTTVLFGLRRHGIRFRMDRIAITVGPSGGRFTPYEVRSASSWSRSPRDFGPPDLNLIALDARRATIEYLGGTGRILGEPYLEWLNPNPGVEETHDLRPAWRVAAAAQDPVSGIWNDWLVYVNAENGVIERATVDEETLGDREGEIFEIKTANYTTDGCWDSSDDVDLWFTTLSFTPEYDALPTGGDTFSDGINAFNEAHRTYHYFFDNLQLQGWDNLGGLLDVFVDSADPQTGSADWNNASFRRACTHIKFGDGWVTPDLFGHEFTHAVVRFTSQLEYENQSGALNESYADFFGSLIDGDWEIGEGRNGTSGPFRNMADPPAESDPDHRLASRSGDGVGQRADVTTPTTANDNGSVHTNSGIPNKVAFLMVDGGWHNGLFIGGLGEEKAARLQYSTLKYYLNKSSTFQHARDMTVENAQRFVREGRYGFTSDDACDVINAWSSVGYGIADIDCNGFSDSPGGDGDYDGTPNDVDNCPANKNVGQRDLDSDGTGDECDLDDDGDGTDDSDDNCRRKPNPAQVDSDLDGAGDVCDDDDDDGVLDVNDNCPKDANRDQADFDFDGQGDACDQDADNDGWIAGYDNCPLKPNAGQEDGDGDNHGDACDNCPSISNSGQEDLDNDDQGDVCDNDDDGDQHSDIADNCPLYYNPRQADNDLNGIGLYCDAGEQFQLTAFADQVELDIFVQNNDPLKPIRFPLYPCGQGTTCPAVLPEVFRMTVEVDTVPAYRARIVDDRGWGVTQAASDPSGSYVMEFNVDSEYYYMDANQTAEFKGRKYFLELMAPAGAAAGQQLTGAIRVMADDLTP